MKHTFLILLTFFTLLTVTGQESINDYKYIIVPEKFDFLDEADEYMLNSLTQFLFKKYNFDALMENSTPPSDYGKNNCLGLRASVLNESSLFKTNLKIELKNCKNEIIFTSDEGESREKKYKVAYNEALRDAFKSVEALNYSYSPNNSYVNESVQVVNKDLDVEKEKEIENLKKEIKGLKEENEDVTIKQELDAVEDYMPHSASEQSTKTFNVLFAQKVANGYLLVDKSPKIIFKIRKTGMSNVFLVEDRNAIIYQLDANWILEYYENEKLETKILNIKF